MRNRYVKKYVAAACENKPRQSASLARGEYRYTHIERDERDNDSNVSPPIRVLDVERKIQVLVRGPERTEFTS